MEQFNDNQLAFIQCDESSLLLASAGTGKTKSIAAKVSRLIKEKHLDAKKILCLSFTNKACDEMKERVLGDVGGDALPATIKTFHAFCFQIISEEKIRTTGLFPEEVIYDEDDCSEVVKSVTPLDSGAVLKFIDFIKEKRISDQYFVNDEASDLIDTANNLDQEGLIKLENALGKKLQALAVTLLDQKETLLSGYEHALEENHALDFNDLVSGVYRLFKDDSLVKRWQERYSFICIDEAQDTSLSEYRLLQKLFGGSQIVLCGDFFQTIYQWRGSEPDLIIREFRDRYAPQEFSFDVNYRSTKTLVDAGYAVLQRLFGDRVKSFYPNGVTAFRKEAGSPILITETTDPLDEAEAIFEEVTHLRDYYPLSKMCILTRSNNYGLAIASYFRERSSQLKCFVIGDLKFYRRSEIKDALAFMRLLVNPYDSLAVARIAEKYIPGVGSVTLNEVIASLKDSSGLNLADFVNVQTLRFGDPYLSLLSALDKSEAIVFDTETTGLDVNKDEIVQISAERINSKGKVLGSFNRFLRPSIPVGPSAAIHGYSDAFLKENGEDPILVLKDFLEFIKGCILVGHNVSFDCGILFSEARRYGVQMDGLPEYFDTCVMAKSIYQVGPKNYKLSYLSQEYFHFSHVSSHQANDDVAATVELLMKMLNEAIIPGTLRRQQIISQYGGKFLKFATALEELTNDYDKISFGQLVEKIIDVMKIRTKYSSSADSKMALDNLIANAEAMAESSLSSRENIQEFLNKASLTNTEMDAMCKKDDMLPIITVHQAKGAEFDVVFLAGVNDHQFPNFYGNSEEEKRIFYVAITRAKELLYISYTSLNKNGYPAYRSPYLGCIPSFFVAESKR
jgi:DNA helicase-2/ATP-dependent DNA helicase PcrA